MTTTHTMSVRGLWQNIDAAGIVLACSCGWYNDWLPDRFSEDAETSLGDLNALAGKHLQDTA